VVEFIPLDGPLEQRVIIIIIIIRPSGHGPARLQRRLQPVLHQAHVLRELPTPRATSASVPRNQPPRTRQKSSADQSPSRVAEHHTPTLDQGATVRGLEIAHTHGLGAAHQDYTRLSHGLPRCPMHSNPQAGLQKKFICLFFLVVWPTWKSPALTSTCRPLRSSITSRSIPEHTHRDDGISPTALSNSSQAVYSASSSP
jgi:hypothetical protein